jgi:quercetin dioxygenase-like cupin family protein
MQSLQINPYMLECDEGQRLETWGARVVVKAGTEETGGVFNLLEVTGPGGFATPLHIHYAEDVAVYVLEGSLTIYWGDERKEASAGSYFFQPRGTPHGFRVMGDSRARVLYLTVPAGFDRFVVASGSSGDNCEPMTTAACYKIEILGPLPD